MLILNNHIYTGVVSVKVLGQHGLLYTYVDAAAMLVGLAEYSYARRHKRVEGGERRESKRQGGREVYCTRTRMLQLSAASLGDLSHTTIPYESNSSLYILRSSVAPSPRLRDLCCHCLLFCTASAARRAGHKTDKREGTAVGRQTGRQKVTVVVVVVAAVCLRELEL